MNQSAWWWYLVLMVPLLYLAGVIGSNLNLSYILIAPLLYGVGYAIGAGRRTAFQREITARQATHEKAMRDEWETLAAEIRKQMEAWR